MITPATLPIFPGCSTFGFSAQPDLLVRHVMREGGYENSNRQWAHPLLRFEGAPMGPRPEADIELLLNFWRAIGGTSSRFLFTDWSDYKSCPLGEEPTPLDQPFQFTPGSPGGYQLLKVYGVDGFPDLTELRRITRPIGSTIRVANDSGVEQPASSWTIEEDTGLLTPGVGFSGSPASWGGEFYVKCRFDGPFRVELINHKIQNLTVSVIESREGST